MNILKKIGSKIFQKILESRFVHPNTYAIYRGVSLGKNCNFLTKKFGSEPYLIKVGNNVTTSSDVTFITHDGAVQVLRTLDEKYQKIDLMKPITIGNNVFLGLGAIVMPGSTIGDNVIIGAGSIVRGKIKSNSVYAGVPAKYLCSLDEYREKNEFFFTPTKQLNELEKKNYLIEYFKIDYQ